MIDAIYLLQWTALLVLAVGVPAARARWRGGAGWAQIGCALVTWAFVLTPIFFIGWSEGDLSDGVGAMAVFAMFFGWLMVPLIAVFYQVTDTPGWAITLWQQRVST